MDKEKVLVRIELPFCTGHCVYCEKKTYGQNIAYLQRCRRALEKEIEAAGEELLDYDLVSVHLEADSPSLFGVGALDDFLRRLRSLIPGSPQWVVNLMPQELTPEMVHVLLNRQGIDRVLLCLGALGQKELRVLHRPYTQNLAEHAVSFLESPEGSSLRERLGIELFYGIPGQSPEAFLEDLRRVRDLRPLQLSLRRFKNRTLSLPDQLSLSEETPWEDYASPAAQLLQKAGYSLGSRLRGGLHYCLPDGLFAENAPEAQGCALMGFGPGAFTSFDQITYQNTTDLALYLAASDDPDKIAVF